MKKLSSNEIRSMFLKFFEEKNHQVLESASLIPVDDPTLLWINSGVATLKKYFDGSIQPENPRLTNSQKSIRTNDIENVGVTARHHTLFEMLGNFSIGDYFKVEAIQWAWEFLTSSEWLDLDPDKLYVTIYPEDQEARQIWEEKVGLSSDQIIEEEGNFWDIGQGPCGPNTEIFYDRGPEANNVAEDDPENYPGGENERWLEIWNLVFSQFNHLPDDTYEPLPNKNIDTGMGLERIASVIQETPTNFETDLFMPLIEKVGTMTTINYDENPEAQVSYKVIVDHIRAITFAVADGALPSNEGRGYVLRRLLRRAVMHGRHLGINRPFLSELVPVVGKIMGEFYTNLLDREAFVQKVVRQEENRFHETLAEGERHLEEIVSSLSKNGGKSISGADAFLLYDTFGFPFELTEEYAQAHDLAVDRDSFDEEMEKQRHRAREARSDDESMSVQSDLYQELTDQTKFIGYEYISAQTALLDIISDNEFVQEISAGKAKVIFEETPFYAESGGQIGDTGRVYNLNGDLVALVKDVKKAPAGQHLHDIEVLGNLRVDQIYQIEVDDQKRHLTARNHTATHLLHQALHDIVGEHTMQAGSLVAPDHLRFDFTHFEALTEEEMNRIENEVNQKIWDSIPVTTMISSLKQAKEMGAIALFGEKYGEEVRMVQISDYSLELCGGTHVKNTSEIGLFKLVSESGIGAGTRRIIARTSRGAYDYLNEQSELVSEIAQQVKAQTPTDISNRIAHLSDEIAALKRENDSLNAKLSNAQAEDIFKNPETIGNYTLIAKRVEAKDMDQLRQMSDLWKSENASDVLVLALSNAGKVNMIVAVRDELTNDIMAGEIIKAITPAVKGGGGGRPNLAQAGGSYPEGISESFELARKWLEEQSSAS